MARRSIQRPELECHQRVLAWMIDDALKRGQRGDGENEQHWKPWNNRSFADKAPENSVANWRYPDRRTPPQDTGRCSRCSTEPSIASRVTRPR